MSVTEQDRAERNSMPEPTWPAGPSRAENRADEHPTTIRRSRSCGDFLADLRGMGAA